LIGRLFKDDISNAWVISFRFLIYKTTTLRALRNKVLRRIFGPKEEYVTGGWKKNA
jgi:hypothetical protein